MERTKGNYPTLDRVNITTDNRLHLSNKVRSCYKSIIGLMWKGRMSTFPLESNKDFTSPSKKGTCVSRNITYLEIWTDVEAIELIWQPISKGTIFIHKHTTSFIFFGWLEEEEHIIFRPYLKHLVQKTKCCGHVHIVSTSMHTTFMSRLEVKTCFLYDWEAINICTPTNGFFRSMPVKIDKNSCTPSTLLHKVLTFSHFNNTF